MEDGPPFFSPGSTCPLILRIPSTHRALRLRGYHPLWQAFPHLSTFLDELLTVLTPKVLLPLVWPLPLSLATTRGISVDFSSSRYLDVSVPGVPLMHLLIQCMIHGSSPCVFPHSEICGSMLICSSPQLIAACHVLLRLLMPRHSPYALIRLNFLFSFEISVLLNCLSFSKHLGLHIASKRFSFFMLFNPPCGEL